MHCMFLSPLFKEKSLLLEVQNSEFLPSFFTWPFSIEKVKVVDSSSRLILEVT